MHATDWARRKSHLAYTAPLPRPQLAELEGTLCANEQIASNFLSVSTACLNNDTGAVLSIRYLFERHSHSSNTVCVYVCVWLGFMRRPDFIAARNSPHWAPGHFLHRSQHTCMWGSGSVQWSGTRVIARSTGLARRGLVLGFVFPRLHLRTFPTQVRRVPTHVLSIHTHVCIPTHVLVFTHMCLVFPHRCLVLPRICLVFPSKCLVF